jgi:hypothetical protein
MMPALAAWQKEICVKQIAAIRVSPSPAANRDDVVRDYSGCACARTDYSLGTVRTERQITGAARLRSEFDRPSAFRQLMVCFLERHHLFRFVTLPDGLY